MKKLDFNPGNFASRVKRLPAPERLPSAEEKGVEANGPGDLASLGARPSAVQNALPKGHPPTTPILAQLGFQSTLNALPLEGSVAQMLENPGDPAPLSPEKAEYLRHELTVLDDAGYLYEVDEGVRLPSKPSRAFSLLEEGESIYFAEYRDQEPTEIRGWKSLEETAQKARNRVRR